MLFKPSKKVLLKVPLVKGVMWFGKKGNLRPQYIGLFEVLGDMGRIAYRLVFPSSLSGFYPVFYILC